MRFSNPPRLWYVCSKVNYPFVSFDTRAGVTSFKLKALQPLANSIGFDLVLFSLGREKTEGKSIRY